MEPPTVEEEPVVEEELVDEAPASIEDTPALEKTSVPEPPVSSSKTVDSSGFYRMVSIACLAITFLIIIYAIFGFEIEYIQANGSGWHDFDMTIFEVATDDFWETDYILICIVIGLILAFLSFIFIGIGGILSSIITWIAFFKGFDINTGNPIYEGIDSFTGINVSSMTLIILIPIVLSIIAYFYAKKTWTENTGTKPRYMDLPKGLFGKFL